MTQSHEEIFKAMNASNILVAILAKINSIDIPVDLFISSNNEEKQLSVTYNEETNSFEFKLREEDESLDNE